MKRIFIVATAVLIVASHRLPAPIREEPTPTPKPARSALKKEKAVEISESNFTRRFDGTWKGTFVKKTTASDYSVSYTLIIRDGKTADSASEATRALHSPVGWGDLPEAYRHVSPLSVQTANHSDHLVCRRFRSHDPVLGTPSAY